MVKQLLTRLTRQMPLLVAVFGIAALFVPQLFTPFKPFLSWVFAATMLGIGLVMDLSEFTPVLRKPGTVIKGVFAQFLIMPLMGFLIGRWMNFEPSLILGMVLVGAVPGAMASNVIAYLAKTDVAYSIALTSCATLLAPILTPGLIFFYAHTQIDIPFLGMVQSIVQMVLLPLLTGLLIRRSFPKQIGGIDFVFPALSSFSIILICSTIIALNQEKIFSLSLLLFAAVILHNAAGYLFGYQAGRIFRFDTRMKKTLSIEVGMQNAGMGAVLALNHFDAETALIPAVFAVWCVITASILAEFWRRMN